MMSSTRKIISEASVADRMICSLTCSAAKCDKHGNSTAADVNHKACVKSTGHIYMPNDIVQIVAEQCTAQPRCITRYTHIPDKFNSITLCRVNGTCLPCSIHRCPNLTCHQPCLAQHPHPCGCPFLRVLLSAVISIQQSQVLQSHSHP